MKIQNPIIMLAIVVMLILSVTTFTTFSFAVTTNSSSTGSQRTTNTTRIPSQIITNPTTALQCDTQDEKNVAFLWNHVYGASGDGKEFWNRPNQAHQTSQSRLNEIKSCVAVTGQVYSIHDPSHPGQGTHDDPDGDLHFTLTLLDNTQYSKNDPPCTPSHGLPNPCHNIIVEAICHTTPTGVYAKTGTWGDYCNGVRSVYPQGQFPKQGDKLTVYGKLVFDNGREQWNEIHPASTIHEAK